MNGGTNFVTYLYSNGVPRFAVGANSTVSVNANAVLNLTNSTGTNMDLIAGYGTAGGKLVVNGGVVTGYRQLQIGATTGTGNSVIVTNGGTLFRGSGGGAGTLGIGAGQMSRVDSARIASIKAENAGLSLKGSAVASDAFFPFPDGLIAAAEAGATAAIQPGGSVRDAEVLAAADERKLAMVFTGVRHFRH